MCAAMRGHPECTQILIKAGSDVTAKDTSQYTALMWAAVTGYPECTQMLIEAGSDVTAKSSSQYTALMCAAEEGHPECTQMLIEAGSDVTARDSRQHTALMYAVLAKDEMESRWDEATKEWVQSEDHKAVVALLEKAMQTL